MKIKISSAPGSTKKNKTGAWRTYKPVTDFEKCISCGLCAKVCPEACVIMQKRKDGKEIPITDYDYCKGCGICAAECPVKAIKMELEKK